MKKIIFLLLILVMCNTYQMTAQAKEAETLPSEIAYSDIEAKIDDYVAKNKATTAAVSVAVFDKDNVLMEKAYGYTDLEKGIANDSEAVFEWGSCTKLITWVSVMQLVEKGKLDLNKDIREYLPEGFLRKLKYYDPITMLNLMNHNAGWQETVTDLFYKNKEDIKSLGDALKYMQPEQINRPGEIVAYSNWGAALAGYIVERVSGQSFSNYVHENIFEPLGMEHTALSPDLSDNEWVAKKRMEEKCYTTSATSLGTCFYYLPMYPAGMATGTLDDFMKFAQAFVPADGKISPLFQKAETLKLMQSPSLYYADEKTGRVCHGFWTDQLSVPVLWHNGGTNGSTSWLAYNPETGVGMVTLTNQSDESVYNCGLLPLVFGTPDFKTNTKTSADISGVYVSARSCFKGFSKLYSLFSIMGISPAKEGVYSVSGTDYSLKDIGNNSYLMNMGLKQFYIQTDTGKNGRTILQMAGADYIKVNGFGVLAQFAFLILFVIASLYSLVLLIIKAIRFIRRKKAGPMGGYQIALNASVLGAFTMFLYIAIRLFTTASAMFVQIQWSLVVCLFLSLIPLIVTAILIVRWRNLECSKKAKVGLVINCILGLIMTFNVVFWDAYKFW